MLTMDQLIDRERDGEDKLRQAGAVETADKLGEVARRLEECRALLQRLANDEPAPEGHTFQSWARELLG